MMKLYFLILTLLLGNLAFAQNSTSVGVLPKIVISVNLSKNLKLVNKIESRQVFFNRTSLDNFQYGYDYKLTDISSLIALKTAVNQSLAFGYRIRVAEKKVAHQLIQQFSFVQNLDASRIGHRFSTDQTFLLDEFALRVRYRISFEKPLNGDKIDPKEFYLKISNEYLAKFTNNKKGIEIRLTPLVGYEINKANNIEFGVDYRLSDFINSDFRNRLWLSIGWYFNIGT